MATTVSPARVRRPRREPAKWAKEAARYVRRAPQTIEAWIVKERRHEDLAAIVREAIATGNLPLAHEIWSTIDQAYRSGRPIPELTPELIQRVQRLDLEEDLAEAAYQANQSLTNLDTWIAAQRAAHAADGDLLAAKVQARRMAA